MPSRNAAPTAGPPCSTNGTTSRSVYARNGLRSLINRIYRGEQAGWRIGDLEDVTGLRLTTKDGALVENLPPMSRFLNRLLALRIEEQNELFGYLETIIDNSIEHRKTGGRAR